VENASDPPIIDKAVRVDGTIFILNDATIWRAGIYTRVVKVVSDITGSRI